MASAIHGLLRTTLRAERERASALVATYVPLKGVTDALLSPEHHVIVGHRGTGKTHALRYLEAQVVHRGLGVPIRSDLRLVWEHPFPSDGPPPLTTERAERVVSALLEDIVAQVSEVITAPDGPIHALAAADAIDALSENVALAAAGIAERAGGEIWACISESIDVLAAALPGRRLWLLIDGWDTLDMGIADDFSWLLERLVGGSRSLTVKCATLSTARELTPTLSQGRIDLNGALSFYQDPVRAGAFCEELLFRRLLHQTASTDRSALRQALFPDADSVRTLAQASNGAPRDALNLAILAASRGEDGSISPAAVRMAAAEHYARNRAPFLPPHLEVDLLLRWIHGLGDDHGSPSMFVLSSAAARSPLIEALEAGRVLCRVPSPESADDEQEPDLAFRLDLGCYLALRSPSDTGRGEAGIRSERDGVLPSGASERTNAASPPPHSVLTPR